VAVRWSVPRRCADASVQGVDAAAQEHPPADPSRYRFVRTVTGGSADVTFGPEHGGGNAAYLVRWVSATGEPGPWGETVTATIAA
jgi:hypothetical protein